ncbi:MAG: DUF1573 domain-containing protein [Bacteroidales bacterium]|nr:DUF1573 domain-containing protein [Bacteroidales bacterium]RLD30643.1 MAG: hypothetical protein DRI73_10080 [Bacteroidota bacterium]RLD77259.1 MAG: hypothetical protein DRJ07_14975 [Bacteroidota bacterium]
MKRNNASIMQLKETLTCIIFLLLVHSCKTTTQNNNAQIRFEKTEYNFGELKQNSPAQTTFTFTNPGQTPLLILDVKTTCGCTVPKWPEKPVKPGKKGEIIVTFDTSHPGVFSKTIFVSYNGKDSPVKLTIRGEVK